MRELRYDRKQVEALGLKLDRLAEDLTDEEKYLLATVFELASQRASGDPNLALSHRLQRVLGPEMTGRLDAGVFHVII